METKIGIIGGTGIYSSDFFKKIKEIEVATPYGPPSDKIKIAEIGGKQIAFLPRHGEKHEIPPHKVNSLANIWALKELGVTRIIGLCAVGSLKEEMKPGDMIIPDQYIDFTKQRKHTFYDGSKVMHVSAADPLCPELRKLAKITVSKLKIPYHDKGTYVCIDGPRFSTRAESKLWRTMADIIGMTLLPEAALALEMELCYLCVAAVSDYDVWAEKPVTMSEIIETMKKNTANMQNTLKNIIVDIPEKRECPCCQALKYAGTK